MRALAAALAVLLLTPIAASAQIQAGPRVMPLFGGSATVAQATTTYMVVGSTTAVADPAPTASTGDVTRAPVAGTLKNLRVMQLTAPAAGQTATFTVMTATAIGTALSSPTGTLTCQITSASSPVACTDLTHSVSLNAGDTFAVQVVTSATSGSTGAINWSMEFDGQ